jgi:hypothetical protein
MKLLLKRIISVLLANANCFKPRESLEDMFCLNNQYMCSGCLNDMQRQWKTLKLEQEILKDTASNQNLAPILQYISTPTTLKHLRWLYLHSNIFLGKKRDDHIFGATRCLANTLGISIEDSTINNFIDQPMAPTEKKQIWRIGTFWCRFENEASNKIEFGPRAFCQTCSMVYYFLLVSSGITQDLLTHATGTC